MKNGMQAIVTERPMPTRIFERYTETDITPGQHTPRGASDFAVVIASIDGKTHITRYDTPSHGGYYVPDEFLARIPEDGQRSALRCSGGRNWYEEDCDWAYVAVAFPDLFPVEAIEQANQTLKAVERWRIRDAMAGGSKR